MTRDDILDPILHPGPVNIDRTQRVASVAGGAALAAAGLSRGSLGGALLALGGAVLVHRGATGHCMVFDALGIDTAGEEERAAGESTEPRRRDPVTEASMESFPASDAPAWTGTT